MATTDDVFKLLNDVNQVTLKRMEEKIDAINAVTLKRMEDLQRLHHTEQMNHTVAIEGKLGVGAPGPPQPN